MPTVEVPCSDCGCPPGIVVCACDTSGPTLTIVGWTDLLDYVAGGPVLDIYFSALNGSWEGTYDEGFLLVTVEIAAGTVGDPGILIIDHYDPTNTTLTRKTYAYRITWTLECTYDVESGLPNGYCVSVGTVWIIQISVPGGMEVGNEDWTLFQDTASGCAEDCGTIDLGTVYGLGNLGVVPSDPGTAEHSL